MSEAVAHSRIQYALMLLGVRGFDTIREIRITPVEIVVQRYRLDENGKPRLGPMSEVLYDDEIIPVDWEDFRRDQ